MQIITSHINADFDSLASMVAAKKLYPEAEIVFSGSQEKKVRDFIEAFQPLQAKRIRDIDPSEVRQLIIVDTKAPERIGPFTPVLSKAGIRIHVYDHHPFRQDDIHGEVEITEEVGATTTIFVEILKKRAIPLTPLEATIFCLGIYEETGSLLFPTTTERDVLAVAYLIKRGANLNIVSSFIKTELNREELDLLNELIQSTEETVVHGIRVNTAKAYKKDFMSDAAHLAHRIMDLEDIDALIILIGMEDKILIVGRSRVPELDVGEVMKEFGGGGHPSAAAATVKEASLELLQERVLKVVRSVVRPGKFASDIMTSPVITTNWDNTIKEVEATMTRYGVNVLPVMKAGKYTGIISREIVEKAIFHAFGRSKAMDFTTVDAITVEPGTPIREIETTMIEQNQRFMPVLDGEKIVGAISRTDLLRALYEEFLRRTKIDKTEIREKPSMGRNIEPWLKERFPSGIYRILRLAGEIAEGLGFNAYLVGGSVRDIIRGVANLDIDIVIEGDGIAFAENFAGKINARVKTHRKFGTAQVMFKGVGAGKRIYIDVASARTEYYESPAALPTVEMSSIKKDLYRRDFTINTLAVKLNRKDFGLLIDFFGGQRDIKEKTIRVLHNLSFIEDPTRAFRAVRFSERFGFKLSKHTENLIKSAIKLNLFDRLSGARLYDELMLTFYETEPGRALKRLSEFGLLGVIHPKLVFSGQVEKNLASLHDTLSWFDLLFLEEKYEKGILYLMILFSGFDEADIKTALIRLSAPPRSSGAVVRGISQAKDIARMLPSKDPAVIYKILSAANLETILFVMAVSYDKQKQRNISQYLTDLRKVRPILTGNDLKRAGIAPGPVYASLLKELLSEKLRGKLKTKEDEERFILDKMAG